MRIMKIQILNKWYSSNLILTRYIGSIDLILWNSSVLIIMCLYLFPDISQIF